MLDHKKLRAVMGARGISQSDLARALSVNRSYVCRMANRDLNVELKTLERLCDVLGVRSEELIRH